MKISIDINKTVAQNAAFYYELSKTMKKKVEGAKTAIQQTKNKIEKIQRTQKFKEQIPLQEKEIKQKKQWFEKFRWFYSSDDLLCIGGRDQTTNDIIVKKHLDKNDFVFHTDIIGSPFFVIKSENKEIPPQTIQEVAQATASFSRAWVQAITTTEVYYVTPDQIKKEFGLPKGTFMIYGKRNYQKPVLEVSVGITKEQKVMCAPSTAIKKSCDNYIVIRPGSLKKSDAAKKIKKYLETKAKIKTKLDDFMSVMPPGNVEIISMH